MKSAPEIPIYRSLVYLLGRLLLGFVLLEEGLVLGHGGMRRKMSDENHGTEVLHHWFFVPDGIASPSWLICTWQRFHPV